MKGRRRFFRRGARRKAHWIDGFSSSTAGVPEQSRVVTFSAGVVANTRTSAFILVTNEDLEESGGEGAVVTRIVYKWLPTSSRNVTDVIGANMIRMVITTGRYSDAQTTIPVLANEDYMSSENLGKETILHTNDFIASPTSILANGTAAVTETSTLNQFWIQGDVRVKRRLDEESPLVLAFQAVNNGVNVPQDFRIFGFMRILVAHPAR
jgi:hypothetical protein